MLVLLAAGLVYVGFWVAEKGGKGGLRALLVLSVLVLTVMLWTDYPSIEAWRSADEGDMLTSRHEFSAFWGDHSLWANFLTTLSVAGVALFGWQAVKERKEEALRERDRRIATTVTSAGLGGLVDVLVEAEELVGASKLDEAVRVLGAGMASWAPLVTQSTYGSGALERIAEIRVLLLHAQRDGLQSDDGRRSTHQATARLRFFAFMFESLSLTAVTGSDREAPVRPGLKDLSDLHPSGECRLFPAGGGRSRDQQCIHDRLVDGDATGDSLPDEWRAAWDEARVRLEAPVPALTSRTKGKDTVFRNDWQRREIEAERLRVVGAQAQQVLPPGSWLDGLNQARTPDEVDRKIYVFAEFTVERREELSRAWCKVYLHKARGIEVVDDSPLVARVLEVFPVPPKRRARWSEWMTVESWSSTDLPPDEIRTWLSERRAHLAELAPVPVVPGS